MRVFPLILFTLCAGLITEVDAQRRQWTTPEASLRAAMVVNFLRFTRYPKCSGDCSEFSLCVMGNDPFGSAFKSLDGMKLRKQTITIWSFTEKSENIKKCNAIFVSSSPSPDMESLQRELGDLPVLLLAEQRGFLEKGGHINFVPSRKRVAFEVNRTAAQAVNLDFSAKMLDLAVAVE